MDFTLSDGLLWPSLFSVSNEREKRIIIRNFLSPTGEYQSMPLASLMLRTTGLDSLNANDPQIQRACEITALKFMLHDTTLAKDVLTPEELMKASEVFARKQYNSKLLIKLLHGFAYALMAFRNENGSETRNLFTVSILTEYRKLCDEDIAKNCEPLKKMIDRVASGVRAECYTAAEHAGFFVFSLSEALDRFVNEKTGYAFNECNDVRAHSGMSTLVGIEQIEKANNQILRLALLDDLNYWSKHETFSVVAFLNKVEELNGPLHAEKVLAHILNNLKAMPYMDIVFNYGFPLYVSRRDELVERLEDQAYRFSLKRIAAFCDVSVLKNVHLCHPMNKADGEQLKIGKELWRRFICEYNYPHCYEEVNSYLINEVNRSAGAKTFKDDDIAVILDTTIFRASADNEDRAIFNAYYPDCFSEDSIWNRVYTRAYAVTLVSSDDQTRFSYLQRIFVDLIKTIERRLDLHTVHQLDTDSRDKSYNGLKALLKKHGISINDVRKSEYVTSLLDRDTATMEEAVLFPILEQTGDAIYGLAIAEMKFYDPNSFRTGDIFNKYVSAEKQVIIAKAHGLDKLYLRTGLPAKYVEYDTAYYDFETFDEEKLQELNQEKYLADTLEMIIGAVARDCGIDVALKLSKDLIRAVFPKEFADELRPEEAKNAGVDADYWARILPPPCSAMTEEQRILWNAFNKVVLIATIGTDDKKKRRFITNSFGNTAVFGEKDNYGVSWIFYDYLNHGLVYVVNKYGDVARNNYENKQ